VSAYFYPTARNNAAGAIPVYIVAAPPVNPFPPNAQTNILGAIPVTMVAAPVVPNAGAIPVRVVAGPGTPPFASDQAQNDGAIPVYLSVSVKAMPVWRVN
jgi:hypothetical protein